MTLQEYSSFVVYDQYKWRLAYKQQQILPIKWRTLTYKIRGADETEETTYAEYFQFCREMYDRWINLDAEDKTRPVLNVFKTAEYLTVCYTVWNGRVYLPSEKISYQNLPELNNCNIYEAINTGLINQVADYMQFEVVGIIWTTLQLQKNHN